jgi:CHAT domain-containing protein
VDGFQIGTLFKNYPETRLILLNACEGARNSREDPLSGVATALVVRGIPAVVGMQFEISDRAAITFSSEFYSALVDGLPVDAALAEARQAIFFLPNWIEWATPVLFMRSNDGVLFKIQRRYSRESAESLTEQKVEQERLEKEKDEAERVAREMAEAKRLAEALAEQERLEKAEAEAELLAKEKTEVYQLAKEKQKQTCWLHNKQSKIGWLVKMQKS